MKSRRHYNWRKRRLFIFLVLTCLGALSLLFWIYKISDVTTQPQPIFLSRHDSTKRTTLGVYSKFGIKLESVDRLQQDLFWPGPDGAKTSASEGTSASKTTFSIQDLKKSYKTGEQIQIMVHARDFNNQPKAHGGDFFQAKLFWSKTKASVFGEVQDLQNGSYSIRFLLPWAGLAQVSLRLIHSSEAVMVLKDHRDRDSDRVYFTGIYETVLSSGIKQQEEVPCNVKWHTKGLDDLGTENCCCEYKDPGTEETWSCERPKTLPCNALVYHKMGGYRNRLTEREEALMSQTNVEIHGDNRIITVLHPEGDKSSENMGQCRPGLQTPVPAGFYVNDVWTSLLCQIRHFTAETTKQCLKDKIIHMMGDSTLRQWFDFLVKQVPSLKQMNLHDEIQTGPLMAVDVENNLVMHWRSHGLPLRTLKSKMPNVHYISNEIDGLGGGAHTVIVFTLGPHFTTYPLDFFIQRVLTVRRAVVDLLRRDPATIVIIKTSNTGYKDIFGSDWYSLQLNKVLQWAFQDVAVFILDVWQMTACHYSTEAIHPGPVIIRNEIDVLLSFICPE